MAKNFLTNIDLNKNQLLNAVIQVLASDPSNPNEGQVYYNSTDNTFYGYDGTTWIDLGVQGGAGATNLSFSRDGTTVTIESDTGTNTTIPSADTTNAGVMSAADKTKLDGIESGAAADQSANEVPFTSSQGLASTDVQAAIDEVKVYVDTSTAGLLDYKGGYDASTNTPDLDTSPSGIQKGDMYTVTVAGTFFTEDMQVGDSLIAEIDNPTTLDDWTRVNKNIPDVTGKHQEDIVGDNTSTTFTVTHNFSTKSVVVSIRDVDTDEIVITDIIANTVNTVQISFAVPPATSKTYNVTVI